VSCCNGEIKNISLDHKANFSFGRQVCPREFIFIDLISDDDNADNKDDYFPHREVLSCAGPQKHVKGLNSIDYII